MDSPVGKMDDFQVRFYSDSQSVNITKSKLQLDDQEISIEAETEKKLNKPTYSSGPVKVGWESLPILVFRVLFKYVDYQTRIQMRLVCSSWLDIIELESGLKVDVHDSVLENMQFVKSVKVKELYIHQWFVPKSKQLLDPSELEVVGLYGTTCAYWFHFNMIKDFSLVKKLILRGKFLSHLELEKVGGQNEHMGNNTENIEGVPSLVFEHLENLIIMGDSDAYYTMDTDFFSSSTVCLSPMRQNIMRSISSDIAKNICYLLNNICSKVLKEVKVFSYQVSVPQDVNWKYNPLERFLEFHAQSLETLLLPEFSGKNDIRYSQRDFDRIPSNLKMFKIYLCCFLTRNRFGGVQNPIYWLKLILNQHQLENLNLEMVSFPQNFMTPLMNAVVAKNSYSLREMELVYIPAEWKIVNGRTFSRCHVLESLRIIKYTDSRPTSTETAKFINLSLLPASLKTLELTGFLVDTSYADVSKFVNLKRLILQVASADVVSPYKRNVQMIGNFLNLRHMEHFDFYIDKPPHPLALTKIKNFVYKGNLLKEHILSTNYLASLSVDYGMQILITDEISTIRYAPSICRMHNADPRESDQDISIIQEGGGDNYIAVDNVPFIVHDDIQIIALVEHDLGLV